MTETTRRLAVILFADIQGYTARMEENEQRAKVLLHKFRSSLMELVPRHNGQIVQFYGDGCLSLFDLPREAATCAVQLQQHFKAEPNVPVRLGIHMGTVSVEDNNVFGNAVNLSSRIESMGVPGSVLVSQKVRDELKNQDEFELKRLGKFNFKNVEEPLEVFALSNDNLTIPKPGEMKGKGSRVNEQAGKSKQRIGITALALALLSFAIWWFYSNGSTADPPELNTLTVFPFDVKGSSEITYLGEAMVDLISTKLDGIPGIHPVDPNRMFNELDTEGSASRKLDVANRISNGLGASEFIIGSIVELDNRIEVTATKYNKQGKRLSRKTIEGEKNNLSSIVDQLTRDLIREEIQSQGLENNSLASMTTDDLDALKAFLLGEQAYRKGFFRKAYQYYDEATRKDSSFAFAWVRLLDAASWNDNLFNPMAYRNAKRFQHELPPKWQDLLKVREDYNLGLARTEGKILDLMKKYGETREFTNQMAEYLFHLNPVHGRSYKEAKPWLEKTRELDPNNIEALVHLFDIAFSENDLETMENIISNIDSKSQNWPRFQTRFLASRGIQKEEEMQEVMNHPFFNPFYFGVSMAAPEDVVSFYEFSEPYYKQLEDSQAKLQIISAEKALHGQEEEGFLPAAEMLKSGVPLPTELLTLPSLVIGGKGFLPLKKYYAPFREKLVDQTSPKTVFARIKYSLALGDKPQEIELLKEELRQMAKEEIYRTPSSFYLLSIEAYEARLNEDNETALRKIDSAFLHSPGFWAYQQGSIGKIFMLADIYEEQGEYEKSIARLENVPITQSFSLVKGYTTYRLSKLYELNGQLDKAMEKCNLLINSYQNCDEQYRPWLEECIQRRDRLQQLKG